MHTKADDPTSPWRLALSTYANDLIIDVNGIAASASEAQINALTRLHSMAASLRDEQVRRWTEARWTDDVHARARPPSLSAFSASVLVSLHSTFLS